jgi:hypothetical protein
MIPSWPKMTMAAMRRSARTSARSGFFRLPASGTLPRTPVGRGEVEVTLTIAGKAANVVKIAIK